MNIKAISSWSYTEYYMKKRYFILKITARLIEWLIASPKWTVLRSVGRLERKNRKMTEGSESSPFITSPPFSAAVKNAMHSFLP